jgi:hypothetical protein
MARQKVKNNLFIFQLWVRSAMVYTEKLSRAPLMMEGRQEKAAVGWDDFISTRRYILRGSLV